MAFKCFIYLQYSALKAVLEFFWKHFLFFATHYAIKSEVFHTLTYLLRVHSIVLTGMCLNLRQGYLETITLIHTVALIDVVKI